MQLTIKDISKKLRDSSKIYSNVEYLVVDFSGTFGDLVSKMAAERGPHCSPNDVFGLVNVTSEGLWLFDEDGGIDDYKLETYFRLYLIPWGKINWIQIRIFT